MSEGAPAARPAPDRALCPSAPCRRGALLLGTIEADGRFAHLPAPVPVTDRFETAARQGRRPETRFRFASPCLRTGCEKWNGACGVAAAAVGAVGPAASDRPLPACAIREGCRWYLDHGGDACAACAWVVTARDRPAP